MKASKIITSLILTASLASSGASVLAADENMPQDSNAVNVTATETQTKKDVKNENQIDAEADKNLEKENAALEKQIEKETNEAEKSDKITVKINDKEIDFAKYDNVLPYIENNRTLIPIRAIAEGLGLDVNWNNTERKVEISGKVKIVLQIDSASAEVNGEIVTLDVAAHVINDRTFVPLRFISEEMGVNVEWDDTTKTANIREPKEFPGDGNSDSMPDGHKGGFRIEAGAPGDRKPVTETDPEIVKVINEGAEKFQQFTFEDEITGISLEYSMYIPENYDKNKEYPMIMYIPDASGASKSAKEIVEQYYGANVWVTNEEQEKHEAFVLVPAFSVIVVDDNHNTSEEIETAVNLINTLTESYSIDTNRLYTTGQSMGCMTSLYLNSKYPDLFAASLFVSGQWDISVLQPLENKKFFYITAGGDGNASGGQTEVMEMFDADGIGYSYGTWSAQNSVDEQNTDAQQLIAQGNNANMIRFETGSVLNGASGMEHNASFIYGYKIPAVRDWLFEQTK